jgi:CheY-like chemotaxis protein
VFVFLITREIMKILAVDDEPFILELMPKLAARVGFPDVTTAASGKEALDVLATATGAFECLILDINMPGMDGMELCRRVRQIAEYRSTPIVMLTAMSEREFMDAAFQAGATDYATKPFDVHEFGTRLRLAHELGAARRLADAAQIDALPTDLAAAVPIENVPGVIDFESFRNYLAQCSRAGFAASQLMAVKVGRIEHLHSRVTPSEFLYALREVAMATAEVMMPWNCLIAYAGSGIFTIVSNHASVLPESEIESDIQHHLDTRDPAHDDGRPMDLEVFVGKPMQPGSFDHSAIAPLIERVIARAEKACATRADLPRNVVNIRRVQS